MIYDILKNSYFENKALKHLEKYQINILRDFLANEGNILKFHKRYYSGSTLPKIVLCGINPGKNGAGKTGIPFTDFKSLSKLIDGVERADSERSAQFFDDIVSSFGAEVFYKHFYVTNISWLGYEKGGNNLNYYDLPTEAKKAIYALFKKEMDIVQPTHIVSLGQSVQSSVNEIFGNSKSIDTTISLPHPNWCAFPSNYTKAKKKYIRTLSSLMDKENIP